MKLSFRTFLFFFTAFFCFEKSLSAQPGINSNWYFGSNAAVTFNSGTPVTVVGSVMNTNEGSASISDAAGNLLFYTDGTFVYDRNNTQMPNGFGLLGNASSTQSAVICPDPGNANKYYIFTADQGGYGGPNQGVFFSTVDMTLNSGNGDVVIKNTLLDAPPMTEKIVAVRHCNGTDFWIIVHKFGSTEFDAFLLTAAGVNLTPVVSNVGTTETDLTPIDYAESIGYLKASPDGHRLGLGVYVQQNYAEVYDFDNLAGGISNPINFIPNPSTSSYDGEYGCSFSPDNSKFYVGWYGASGTSDIYQYDLSLGTPAAIIASQYLVATVTTGFAVGALQLAPDGKIYVVEAGASYLDAINSPNLAGAACGWQANAFTLTSGVCTNGLPNFVDAYAPSNGSISLGPDTTVCTGTFTLTAAATGTHLWSTGDTTTSITVTTSGTYWVTVQSSACSGTLSDTVQVTFATPPTVNLGPDTVTCNPSLVINCSSTGPYLWNTGATTQSITVSSSGNYWVTVGPAACSATDTINVTLLNAQSVNLGPDTTVCSSPLTITCNVSGGIYLWNTGATTQSISVSSSGNYWVTASNGNCSATDSVNVTIVTAQSVNLGPDIVSCTNTATLTCGVPGANYVWNTGDTSQSIIVSQAGIYSILVQSGICISTDTIAVDFNQGGTFNPPNVFTPDGNNVNDVFDVGNPQPDNFLLEIYDRWGNLLFTSNSPAVKWDGKYKGKDATDGVYYWVAHYSDCGGTNFVKTGFVELVR
jgi:gliding motility-associated-like protein